MPRFHIRSPFGASNTFNDRPTKSIAAPRSSPPISTSNQASLLSQCDTLPTRHPNGQALDYPSYTPSRFYVASAHRTPRRPRQTSRAYLPTPSSEYVPHLHLHFDPDNSSNPNSSTKSPSRRLPSTLSDSAANTTSSDSYVTDLISSDTHQLNHHPHHYNHKHETHSIEHAIRLKAAALRRYLATAAELGDLSVLKQVVSNHRENLSRVRSSRHTALLRLHDATTLTGLPPPATAVAPPLHGTFRRPTPIRVHPSTNATLRVANANPSPSMFTPQSPASVALSPKQQQLQHHVTAQKQVQNQDNVRRVHGYPGRRSPRNRSTLRGRRATSAPHGSGNSEKQSKTSDALKEPKVSDCASPSASVAGTTAEAWSQTLSGSPRRRRYVSILSRKSSGTLRRLSSAGSMLMRRLSRGSVGDEPTAVSTFAKDSSGSGTGTGTGESKGDGSGSRDACGSGDGVDGSGHGDASQGNTGEVSTVVVAPTGVLSSSLDKGLLDRLRAKPANVIAELESTAKSLQTEEQDLLGRLKATERLLEQRRDMHDKAMVILDQFYGSLPGWQQDPITQAMFVETVDMTDAGLETERDLAEARHNLSQSFAALKDHGLALNALQTIGEQLGLFISGLERLQRTMADCDTAQLTAVDGEICSGLRELEKHLTKCVSCAEMAAECCIDAPRVRQIEEDVKVLRDGFDSDSKTMMSMGGKMYENEGSGSLHLAKSAVCDCKLAEKFVQEREKMIADDVESFEEMVEKCEEYVIMERMALVDQHHPIEEDTL